MTTPKPSIRAEFDNLIKEKYGNNAWDKSVALRSAKWMLDKLVKEANKRGFETITVELLRHLAKDLDSK